MRTLYLIGGPMGVGKTTVCQIMKRRLPRAAFLDGDWCWDMDPFVVTEETKAMVLVSRPAATMGIANNVLPSTGHTRSMSPIECGRFSTRRSTCCPN